MLLHHARRPQAGDLSGFYIVRTSNIGFATAWAVGGACIGLERVSTIWRQARGRITSPERTLSKSLTCCCAIEPCGLTVSGDASAVSAAGFGDRRYRLCRRAAGAEVSRGRASRALPGKGPVAPPRPALVETGGSGARRCSGSRFSPRAHARHKCVVLFNS